MGKILHAEKSGYFPFCLLESSPDCEGGKITSSLTNIMGMYWRVKKWKYTASGGWRATFPASGDQTNFSYSGSGEFIGDSFPELENEEELVCGYFQGSLIGDSNISIRYADAEGAAQMFALIFLEGVHNSNKDICSTCFRIDSNDVGGLGNFSSSPNQYFSWPAGGLFEFKFLDQIFATSNIYVDAGIGGVVSNVTLRFVIEPSEYWTYGGTYDATTGQKI